MMKTAIAVIALVMISAVGASAQKTPDVLPGVTPNSTQTFAPKERVNVKVMISFGGTQAKPNSQFILQDAAGTTLWWGIADDASTATIIPGSYTVSIDNGATNVHIAYFQVAKVDGIPIVAKYYLYSIVPCSDLADSQHQSDAGNFGCMMPATNSGTSDAAKPNKRS